MRAGLHFCIKNKIRPNAAMHLTEILFVAQTYATLKLVKLTITNTFCVMPYWRRLHTAWKKIKWLIFQLLASLLYKAEKRTEFYQ